MRRHPTPPPLALGRASPSLVTQQSSNGMCGRQVKSPPCAAHQSQTAGQLPQGRQPLKSISSKRRPTCISLWLLVHKRPVKSVQAFARNTGAGLLWRPTALYRRVGKASRCILPVLCRRPSHSNRQTRGRVTHQILIELFHRDTASSETRCEG
jgi:hypothetical protein